MFLARLLKPRRPGLGSTTESSLAPPSQEDEERASSIATVAAANGSRKGNETDRAVLAYLLRYGYLPLSGPDRAVAEAANVISAAPWIGRAGSAEAQETLQWLLSKGLIEQTRQLGIDVIQLAPCETFGAPYSAWLRQA